MKYFLGAMIPAEINQVIFEEVMNRGGNLTCEGPITVNVMLTNKSKVFAPLAREQNTATWICKGCGARGDYSFLAPLAREQDERPFVAPHHKMAPDYMNERDLAMEIVQRISATWSKEHKFLFDLYLFGIDRRGGTLEQTPLIDLYSHIHKRLCFAVINVLNAIAEASEKEEAK